MATRNGGRTTGYPPSLSGGLLLELAREDCQHALVRSGVLHRNSKGVRAEMSSHASHIAQKEARRLAAGDEGTCVGARFG